MGGQEIIKLENSLLIRQSNAITGARHAMSATEQNIMYMLISQLRDDDPEDKVYSIRVSDLDKLTNSQVNYSHLQEASKKLIGKVYRVRIENESISFAPLNSFLYEKGSGNILLQLSDKIRPFFFALKNNYTLFIFRTALKLKSKYSKRIYEMLSQFKNTGIFKISVQELKERFELINHKTGKEEYSNFNSFATKVLEVAKKEINEHTDISFDYTTKKTGRKITNLEFWISSKEVVKELAEPTPVDLELAKLKERLVTQFQLSKTIAKKILENIPPQEIHKILYDIQVEDGANKIRKIGAYATTIFQNRLDGAAPIAQNSNILKYIPPKPIHQILIEDSVSSEQKLGDEENSIEYSDSIATGRSGSAISIGEQLAQIMASSRPSQVKKPLSEEEKKLIADRDWIWRKLYNDFRIDYLKVDILMKAHSLEDLKEAISKVSEALENQEIPRESVPMIQMLKKQLILA